MPFSVDSSDHTAEADAGHHEEDALPAIVVEPASKEDRFDVSLYLSATGNIGWPTIMTFPQLSYYHSYLGQFMMSLPQEAYNFLLHIISDTLRQCEYGHHLRRCATHTHGSSFHAPELHRFL